MALKKLTELNGILFPNRLKFDCPLCNPTHMIVVPFSRWIKSGGDSIENVSVTPSIRSLLTGCLFHGEVINGSVKFKGAGE